MKCLGSPAKELLASHPATPYNSIRKRIKSVSIKYLKHRCEKKPRISSKTCSQLKINCMVYIFSARCLRPISRQKKRDERRSDEIDPANSSFEFFETREVSYEKFFDTSSYNDDNFRLGDLPLWVVGGERCWRKKNEEL